MRSRSFTFVLFCQPFKKPTTNQKTRNQETKKLKKQETKKPKNQINKKKQRNLDCTPQGGSSGRELGLAIFFGVVCFFGLLVSCFFGFWFCLAIAEKPTTNQKPKNKKKTTNQKKKQDCTTRGGSSGRELGLVILLFCFFFFLLFCFLVSWFCVFLDFGFV